MDIKQWLRKGEEDDVFEVEEGIFECDAAAELEGFLE